MPGVHDLKFEFTGETEAELNVFDEDGGLQGANDSLCRDVGAALSRWYPGHPWMVRAEIENGIVRVAIQGFVQWPYIIHVATLKSDPGLLAVREAGGHLLERFRMPRRGFSLADWRGANGRHNHLFNRNKPAPV